MTDDRSLERAARSWLELGPTRAPEHAVDAALATIQTTRQERDLGIPWRLPNMIPFGKAVLVAAIGVIAIGGALYLVRPSIGPGSAPTASASPTPPMAGPLQIGTYVGPSLQVADIAAAVNADSTLTPGQRTRIIDELLAIKGKSTWTPSLEFRGGQMTERQTVDGVTQIGSFGRYVFPDDRTLVITESIDGSDVVIRYELTIDGDSFTLRRLTPAVDAEDEFVVKLIYESGPFTLRR